MEEIYRLCFKNLSLSQTSMFLATGEAEIRRIIVPGQPSEKLCKTISQKGKAGHGGGAFQSPQL
jgi:hypothetical protein